MYFFVVQCTYIDEVPEGESEEDAKVNIRCGIGPCHPQCLQIFASKKFFTFMLCIFGLIEGALISGECMCNVIFMTYCVLCMLIVVGVPASLRHELEYPHNYMHDYRHAIIIGYIHIQTARNFD